MKKVRARIIGILLLALFLATLAFLVSKSRTPVVVAATEKPAVMDIVEKTVTTGSIVPRKEITVKSRVSGIVNEIFVEPGDSVAAGDRIASIRLVPDNVALNKAESDVRKAHLALDTAQADLQRQQGLRKGNFITDADLEKSTQAWRQAQEEADWAENNLLLLKEGASQKTGQVSNIVFAPSSGTVLDVPVKPGASVIESNTFNEGTTVASIADMGNLMFDGELDESEIGRVREGMQLVISVAALPEARLPAHLDFIAPKGVVNQGAVQFEIKAALTPPTGLVLRAGYSASADIVLGKAEKALSVREQNVLFEGEKTFVEVQTGPNVFLKRPVELGVSDGIHVQVKSGLSSSDVIKVQTVSEKVRSPS
ncbi:MAG TPA: efflux RND transporter periplasmic adaptor subunit [Spirochaetia bacterium]|nr:efflux RND transporter periplasmic adaptor subunit [Spirochaetia bacterium]